MFKGMKINEVLESLENLGYEFYTERYSDGEIFSVVYSRPVTVLCENDREVTLAAGEYDCFFENGVCESECEVLKN